MGKKSRIVTHSGRFQSDELLACGVITLLLEKRGESWEILRSRDMEVWRTADFLLDVGEEYSPKEGKYDHHQPGGAGVHDNGVPYSTFGAIWEVYGSELCGSVEIAERIKQRLVYPIDLGDNRMEVYTPTIKGVHPYMLHDVVMAMNPTWKEEGMHDQYFMDTLMILRKLLEREIIESRDLINAEEKVCEIYEKTEDKRLIILDHPYPSSEVLAQFPEPLFVVKPKHQSSDWEVEAVRNDPHTFTNRKDLPLSWAGKSGDELAVQSGVADAVYCHTRLFVAITHSREGAIKLAEIALSA